MRNGVAERKVLESGAGAANIAAPIGSPSRLQPFSALELDRHFLKIITYKNKKNRRSFYY